MNYLFGYISGFKLGIEIAFPDEFTNGAVIIDLGIFRFVVERI
jgi:hypothetical protein